MEAIRRFRALEQRLLPPRPLRRPRRPASRSENGGCRPRSVCLRARSGARALSRIALDTTKRCVSTHFPFPTPTKPSSGASATSANSLTRTASTSSHCMLISRLPGCTTSWKNCEVAKRSPLKKRKSTKTVSVLKQIHDDLDAAVFDAYGWPRDLTDDQILERLVALNAERAEEEKRGMIRWLRPEFQNPSGITAATQTAMKIEVAAEETEHPPELIVWPDEMPAQIAAVRDLIKGNGGPNRMWSVESTVASFKKAKK